MSPDYIDQFVRRERYDDEDHPLAVFRDFNEWWFDLPPDTRKRTPLVDLHIPDGKDHCESVMWFRTRRTAAEEMESVNEIEADKIVKRRFLAAMGPKFDETYLTFFVKPKFRRS